MKWYRLATDGGDKRAAKRLAQGMSGAGALNRRLEVEAMKGGAPGKKEDKGDCIIM